MKEIEYFLSYLKTLFWFYILRKFRNFDQKMIDYFEENFDLENKRDKTLSKKIIEFNKKRLENENI